MALVPVDIDPFAAKQEIAPPGYTPAEVEASKTKPTLVPVDHDPFAGHERKAPPQAGYTGDILTDAPRFVGTAFANAAGGLAATPRLAAQGVDWLGRRVGVDHLGADEALGSIKHPVNPDYPLFPDFQTARNAMMAGPGLSTGGTEYVPTSESGRIGMSALTGAMMAGHPAAWVGGAGAGGGAQLAGDIAEHFGFPPTLPTLAGALLGGKLATSLSQMPLGLPPGRGMAPERAAIAADAQKMGVPIPLGQTLEGRFGRYLNSELQNMPFSRMDDAAVDQTKAFTGRAAKQMGEKATSLTPDVMNAARSRIGASLDDAAKRTGAIDGTQLVNDLANIEAQAKQAVAPGNVAQITNHIDDLVDRLAKNNGTLTGEEYQSLTRYNRPLSRATQNIDPDVRFYARQVRSALDDALERSAPPEVQQQIKDARSQWRNMLTIADNVEHSPTGAINPKRLLADVNRSNSGSVAFDNSDMAKLGRIGAEFVREPPNSGTAVRSAIQSAGDVSPQGLAKTLLMRGVMDPVLGSILKSEMLGNMRINRANNPASVVLQRPSPLAQALIANMAAEGAASRPQLPPRQ